MQGRSVIAGAGIALALLLQSGCASPSAPAAAAAQHARTDAAIPRAERGARPSLLEAPRVERLFEPGWVQVEAAVLASEDEAPAAARERALDRARQQAVEFVAGVAVRSSLLSLEQARGGHESSLLQVLTSTASDALVIDERLLASTVSLLGQGGYRVDVTLQARVLDRGAERGGSFRTEAHLDRDVYREGEEVQLAVRANQDARIYVVSLSDAGATILLPNRHMRDTRTPADSWLRFPADTLRERGVRLRAALPEGEREAQEALIVIALRGDRRLDALRPAAGAAFKSAEADGAPGLLKDVLAPLLAMPAGDWTFDQLVYRIEARSEAGARR